MFLNFFFFFCENYYKKISLMSEEDVKDVAMVEVPVEDTAVAKSISTREDVLERLKEFVADITLAKRPELESLKQTFYRLQKAALEEQIAASVNAGGTAEEFKPEADPMEEQFRQLMNIIKEKRAAAQEAQEMIQAENLKKKLDVLERLRALVEKAGNEGAQYSDFKALVQEWKEIKDVPADKSNELWKSYQQYTEQFYDIQKLNNEFREYDFRKNMEIKLSLCEEAEKLAQESDVVAAFHSLQKLHQSFREAGPVSKESREEVWNRFKAASTVVNKRHQQHFEELKKKEQENLDQKTVICELIEATEYDKLATFQKWNERTQEILALQKKWKEIGFAPAKHNQKIFERYRAACDEFFRRKGEFFKQSKDNMGDNLARKTALCEQAEALKDSTDWKATGDRIAELQKEWREIGPVQKKYSNAIWKRFIEACDYFFEQRDKKVTSKRREESANLAQKKEILAKLKAFDPESLSQSDADEIRALMAEWNGVGFVPFKVKDKIAEDYRQTVAALSAKLRLSDRPRRGQSRGGSRESSISPKDRLIRQYEALKSEIQNYENNLASVTSKSGNGFMEIIQKRVDSLKAEADQLLAQISQADQNSSEE